MALFAGTACFSPRVPFAVRQEWIEYGGKVASLQHEEVHATHVFCDGSDDPWFLNLCKRSMAVFHWSWVSEVVRAQFRLPISSYLIEGGILSAEQLCSFSRLGVSDHSSHAGAPAYTDDVEDSKFLPVEDDSGTRLGSPDVASDWSGMDYHSKHAGKSAHYLGEVSMEGDTLVIDDVFTSGSTGVISVSDALRALSNVQVDGCVQFIPGTIHMGKEFRCSYAH